jgi:FkbM family methyltransferase
LKNVLINHPASFLNPKHYIIYIELLSLLRLHTYRSSKLENFPTFTIHEILYKDKTIFFQSPIRINRFMRGFKHAGRRMWNRYLTDSLISGQQPKTLIDIGANIGEYSYYYLSINRSEVDTYCFEPDPVAIKCLVKNCSEFKFELYKCALSNIQDSKTFWLKPDSADSSFHKSNGNSVKHYVEIRTLDDIFYQKEFSRPVLLKMDAEGHEPEVLRGGIQTLRKVDFITVDAGPERSGLNTSDEVARILLESGFAEVRISSNHIVTGKRNTLATSFY